jgi:beta-galactosidase beta subunit
MLYIRGIEGFNFINTTDLVAIQEGTYEIDGKAIFA